MRVKVKRVREGAVLPKYALFGDAGMDLFSCEDVVVPAWDRRLVRTGVAMEFGPGYYASIRDKSGLALKYGIGTMGGVIEHTYRGEYKVILFNANRFDFEVYKGDRIAQVVFSPVVTAEVCEVSELEDSVRGSGGFGHTGR